MLSCVTTVVSWEPICRLDGRTCETENDEGERVSSYKLLLFSAERQSNDYVIEQVERSYSTHVPFQRFQH